MPFVLLYIFSSQLLMMVIYSVPLLEINGDSFADETDGSQTQDQRGERLIHCRQNRLCF